MNTLQNYEKYRFEQTRLDSYLGWPLDFLDPCKLAIEGFYYTGQKDKVKCFYCELILGFWEPNDDPRIRHRRGHETCRFLRGSRCGNVRIDPQLRKSFPVNALKERPVVPLAVFEKQQPETSVHPSFAWYSRRLESFVFWPRYQRGTNLVWLAAAGFFYMGVKDKVACFHCGEIVCDWRTDDDPWLRHENFNPTCGFVKEIKNFTRKTKESSSRGVVTPPLPKSDEPWYPRLASYLLRVESFTYRSKPSGINVPGMARAGFFQINDEESSAYCFHCGAGIAGWEEIEDPWHIHAVISPNCEFVAMTIGTPSRPSKPLRNTRVTNTDLMENTPVRDEDEKEKLNPPTPATSECSEETESCKDTESTSSIEDTTVLPNLCQICLLRTIDILYIPCFHAISCHKCEKNLKHCDQCHAKVEYKLKIITGTHKDRGVRE